MQHMITASVMLFSALKYRKALAGQQRISDHGAHNLIHQHHMVISMILIHYTLARTKQFYYIKLLPSQILQQLASGTCYQQGICTVHALECNTRQLGRGNNQSLSNLLNVCTTVTVYCSNQTYFGYNKILTKYAQTQYQ